MNKTRLFALACLIAAVPLTYIAKVSAGAVFKTVDEQGNVTFTDNPPADGDSREIKIRPINTQASTAPTGKIAEKKPEEEGKEVPYSASFITQPLNQSTVPPGQTEVVVQISLKPPLQTGHVVKLFHNGQARPPATSTRFTLTDLIRGEHKVRAQIFGVNGNRKAETQTITFYVKRYHP
ncbi:MAG: DUF4124 domain-containing protein [Porticoccaceae bacterium]|nr:DUF4124 domain-containing protein [Porticoccaceae bacterium]